MTRTPSSCPASTSWYPAVSGKGAMAGARWIGYERITSASAPRPPDRRRRPCRGRSPSRVPARASRVSVAQLRVRLGCLGRAGCRCVEPVDAEAGAGKTETCTNSGHSEPSRPRTTSPIRSITCHRASPRKASCSSPAGPGSRLAGVNVLHGSHEFSLVFAAKGQRSPTPTWPDDAGADEAERGSGDPLLGRGLSPVAAVGVGGQGALEHERHQGSEAQRECAAGSRVAGQPSKEHGHDQGCADDASADGADGGRLRAPGCGARYRSQRRDLTAVRSPPNVGRHCARCRTA